MDRPIPLYVTQGVDIAGVGQAVAAARHRLTALHLISCETCLTAAAVVRALCRNERGHLVSLGSHTNEIIVLHECSHVCSVGMIFYGGLTTEL